MSVSEIHVAGNDHCVFMIETTFLPLGERKGVSMPVEQVACKTFCSCVYFRKQLILIDSCVRVALLMIICVHVFLKWRQSLHVKKIIQKLQQPTTSTTDNI